MASLDPDEYAKGTSEHAQQVALFMWAGQNAARVPELALLFAIPNGGQRNKATAGNLKAEGVKAGVPDVMLPVPRHGFAGLFIEMKKEDGVLSSSQKDFWHPRLMAQHYFVSTCFSYAQARDCLRWYLGIE